jgi:type II secretory pathway component GspD/PulD (secretin)
MRSRFLLLTVILLYCIVSPSEAEDNTTQLAQGMLIGQAAPASIPSGMLARISLDLRNIEVADALKFLAIKAGLNIVPTKNVAGRVTLTVENVPVQDIFDIMLRSNSLAYDRKGEIYNIMTETEYKALYGRNFSDTRQVMLFRLKYAIPEKAFTLLDTLKSDIGRILVEPESGTVLLMDTAENLMEAKKALYALEQKSSIKVFGLKYAKAKDIEEQLKAQLDIKKVGTIKADERTNQVIVQALPERMDKIAELISALDKKTKAVLIDIKIIKIKLTNQLESGIEWEGIFNVAAKYGMTYVGSYPFSAVQAATDAWRSRKQVYSDMKGSIGSYPFSGTTSNYSGGTKVTPGERLHVGIIDRKRDFDVMIKYLQTLGKTKILSNPTLAVINNQEAKIHVGERRAYITTTTTTGSTTTTTSEAVTYVDVGIQLSITPMINEDGYVTMKVKPEISSVIGNVTTSSNNLIPVIDTSEVETTVIAKDGATIILGGLGKEEKTESSFQIPILGNIPLLGLLFRSRTQGTERTELLIMLTPIIFEGDTLVTPKGKEDQVFGVKPKKKFDVFRQEVPQNKEPQAEEVEATEQGEAFSSKGFKNYDLREETLPPETVLPSGAVADVSKQVHTPKDFRSYSE